jgi:hypothetical protein
MATRLFVRLTDFRWEAGQNMRVALFDRFIELLFRDSEAYRLALKLYAGRHEVIAGRDAADILRQVIAEYMPKDDEQMPPES